MKYTENKLLAFIFIAMTLFGIPVQAFNYLLMDDPVANRYVFQVSKFYFTVLYIYSLLYIYISEAKESGRFNLIFLFYITFGLFLGTNILFDGFEGVVLGSVNFFTKETFSLSTVIETVSIITVALIGLNLGYIYKRKIYSPRCLESWGVASNIPAIKSQYYSNISILIFAPSFLSTLYKMYREYTQASQYGYLSLYAEKGYLSAPPLINLLDTFTFPTLIIFLIFSKNYEIKKYLSIVYCLALILSMLSGARAEALSQILVILMYFSYANGHKLKVLKPAMILALLVVYSQYISYDRTDAEEISGSNVVVNFLVEQGGSYGVIGYSIEHIDSFDASYKFGVIFSPFITLVKATLRQEDESSQIGRATELISGYGYAYGLSYAVNPDAYLLGLGLGSSYIAEVWIGYGVFAVAFVSFLIILVIFKMQILSSKNPMYFYILLIMAQYILIAPRGALFAFAPYMFRPILVYLLIALIYRLLVNRAVRVR